MVKMKVIYEGELHTAVVHEPTGKMIHTDAPKEIGGEGETFSPTDLLAAAYASCIATTIGVYGRKRGWDLKGMAVEIEKKMSVEKPRRITDLLAWIDFPLKISPEEQVKIQEAAKNCVVHHSLHPELHVSLYYNWKS
jgi:putative redox protein